MPDNEPNGQPAASDAAGQRPTDGTMNHQPTDTTTDAPASGQQPTDGQQPEEVRDPVAKARAEAEAKYRTQLRTVEKRLQEVEAERAAEKRAAEEAQMSELEKAQSRAAESQRKLADTTRAMQERIIGLTIQVQASKLNIIDSDAAVKLMDWTQLQFDEDGTPTNADAVLAALVAAKPYLVAQAAQASAQAPGVGDATVAGSHTANAQLASQLGATNPTRQNGPVTVTANQYMDKAFAADFKNRYGMDLQTAVLRGKATIT